MANLSNFWEYRNRTSGKLDNVLGWRYAVTIIILLLLYAFLIILYRRMNKKRRRVFIITVAAMLPLLELSRISWLLITGSFSVSLHLPLQICRIMLFLEAAAVISDNKYLKTYCYAVGLPAAVLAFTFPTIGVYPTVSFEYLRYVTSHFLLALIPVLWIIGDGFKPVRNLKVLLVLVLIPGMIMLGVNVLLGSNYFYVSGLPAHVSIVIEQPWYFIAISAFMLAIVTLMMLPFIIKKKQISSK